MICDIKISRDHKIRQIEIEYQNVNEATKRRTTRGTREVVVIHPVHELGLVRELNILASKVSSNDWHFKFHLFQVSIFTILHLQQDFKCF